MSLFPTHAATPLAYADIEARLHALPPPPVDRGSVARVVVRNATNLRQTPPRIRLDPEEGVVGDRWGAGKRQKSSQVTLMRADFAAVLADDYEIFGDNLFVTIDTSAANLPPGTVLRVGTARAVVTPKPHTGCHKFSARAGEDARRFTLAEAWVPHQLRGVHLRVLEAGEVGVGDEVVVEGRG